MLVGGVNDTLSLIGTVAALFGLTASQTSVNMPTIPIEDAPFAVRLAVFLVFATGIGWATGVIVRALERLPREIRLITCLGTAVVMAGFVAGLANWLVAPRQRTDLPQEFLVVLMGSMVAIRALVESLGARRGAVSAAQIPQRSLVPLTFAVMTAVILLLAEIGVQ